MDNKQSRLVAKVIRNRKKLIDTEIKVKGLLTLTESLVDVEAEGFIALIQREPFDYTK